MPIRVLPDQLASQIAAGEVVERPASVVKELIENALDAGASTVNVEIRGGGRQLIQVADDGRGIPPDELETAFLRHATSKLESAGDLQAVTTLGFRGEALAAIAAVSQVTAVSRAQGQTAGVRLTLEGGQKAGRETVGAPQGTVIAVANLFYNTPARLKFLKSVSAEKRHIDDHVTRYAMAYPGVRFRLSHDNRITFQSSGSGQLTDVLTAVYGPDTARQLLPLGTDEATAGQPPTASNQQPTTSPIRVSGYVGPPTLHRSNRNQIILYVNGRWIRDNSLSYAVVQAYHTLLPTGRFPMAVIFLDVPAESVDVNVHPAKTEVRFRRANSAFGAVQRAVRRTIIADSPVPHATHFASLTGSGWSGASERGAFSRRDETAAQEGLNLKWAPPIVDGQAAISQEPTTTTLGGQGLPIMRVIGQVGAAYIITEGPEGLYLIDQHAAHERILFEQFMDRWGQSNGGEPMAAQGLVTAEAVHVSPAQATLLNEHLDLLARIGFQVEPFGPGAFLVRTVPALLAKLDPAQALMDVVDELENEKRPLQDAVEAQIILRVCKSAAIKAGQTLSMQEMEAMVSQLERCASPHTCPHGRPTLIHLSASQLAKEFGRT
ncbi:MAG: DNA mismatch repair endonuclease MutL [Chloroflexota bacterium]|nr:MAG: DNA mismatch repair endonuclease MutL [Chloroflexota bacterium]